MSYLRFLVAVFVATSFSISIVDASVGALPNVVEYAKKTSDSICFCPSTLPITLNASVELKVASDGLVYNIHPVKLSSDPQFNAECLEAVATASPLEKPPSEPGRLFEMEIPFNSKQRIFRQAVEVVQLQSAASKNRPEFVLCHRIPVTVLRRYPNAIRDTEIFSKDNLIKIPVEYVKNENSPTDRYLSLIGEYFAVWADFFSSHETCSREALLKAAKDFDPGY